MKQRNKAVPAVYLILEKEGKILIARRCNTGYEDGNYQVPAGHVEEAELPTEAMIREAKEEIGIDLEAKDLELVHFLFRPKHNETGDRIDIFLKAKKWGGEIKNMEPHKCDDIRWVDSSELPGNTTLFVRIAIEEIEKGNIFTELPIKFFKKNNLYKL